MDEPALPKPQRGAALTELAREDLDACSVDELQSRIERLEQEAARARQAMQRKQAGRTAAEALFSLAKG